MAYEKRGRQRDSPRTNLKVGITIGGRPLLLACFQYISVAKQGKMGLLAEAMGEPVDGLPPRKAADLALDAIRLLIRGVGLPDSLGDLKIKDKSKIPTWAVEGHKEQRLLSRSPRNLTVEDIEGIYENDF